MTTAASSFRYWAFISYSHQDKQWSDWLHRALETYRVPRSLVGRPLGDEQIPKRLFPVFRDREELPTAVNLSDNINDALRNSRYLIVICSPRSAVSLWVNEEIKYFKQLGKGDRILCLTIGGQPYASENAESGLLESFPEAIRYQLGADGNITHERAQPLAIDARNRTNQKAQLRTELLAHLLQVPYKELWTREQRRYWLRISAAVCGVLLLIATGSGLWYYQDLEKQRIALEQQVEQFIEQGRQEWLAGEPLRALPYLVAAYRRNQSPALRFLLARARSNIDVLWRSAYAPLQVFGGQGAIRTSRLDKAGARLLTAGEDGTAQLWDTASGSLLMRFEGHTDKLRTAEFSPDESRILTVSKDNTIKIWDTRSGALLQDISGNLGRRAELRFGRFFPDGRTIVVGYGHGAAAVLDANTGALLKKLTGHVSTVRDIRFSPDGSRLLTVASLPKVWDVHTLDLLFAIDIEGADFGLKSSVETAAFSPDGAYIVTSHGHHYGVRVWDAASGQQLALLQGHENYVEFACYSPDGQHIVSTGNDGTVIIWDAKTYRLITRISAHTSSVSNAIFSADGKAVLTLGADPYARLWSLADGRLLQTAEAYFRPNNYYWLLDSKREPRVFIRAQEQESGVYHDIFSGKVLAPIQGHRGEITETRFSADESEVITIGRDATRRYWDIASGSQRRVEAAEAPPWNLSYRGTTISPDGYFMLTILTEEEQRRRERDKNPIKNWGGAHAHRLQARHFVEISDLKTGKLLASYPLRFATYNADGTLLLGAGMGARSAAIWDVSLETKSLEDLEALVEKYSPFQLVNGALVPRR